MSFITEWIAGMMKDPEERDREFRALVSQEQKNANRLYPLSIAG